MNNVNLYEKIYYDEYKIPELKHILSDRGLSIKGKKQDLINRLNENDDMKRKEEGIILLFIKHFITGGFTNIYINSSDTGEKIYDIMSNKYNIHKNKLRICFGFTHDLIDKDLSLIEQNINTESTFTCSFKLC